jgi:hypothetical protein
VYAYVALSKLNSLFRRNELKLLNANIHAGLPSSGVKMVEL